MATKRSDAVIIGDEPITGTADISAGSAGQPATNGGGNPDSPEYIAGYESVDPGTIDGSGPSGSGDTGRRKRGRPFGSRNAKTKTSSQNLSSLEGLLLSIHMMGAAMLSSPELALDPKEATALSQAIAEVQRFYPLTFDPKTMAWLNLAVVAGGIYGPRAILIFNRHHKQKPKLVVISASKAEANAAGPVDGTPQPPTGPTNPSQIFGWQNGVTDE